MITPILTIGKKLDSQGRNLNVTAKLLNDLVNSFKDCQKNNYLPPILEYHVSGDDRQLSASNDALGVIQSLKVEGGKLVGSLGKLQDRFHDLLSGKGGKGFRPYVSVRILPPNHPYNPNPSKWSIGHLALVPLPADPATGSPIEFSQCTLDIDLEGADSSESLLCYNFGIGEPLDDMTRNNQKSQGNDPEQKTLPGVDAGVDADTSKESSKNVQSTESDQSDSEDISDKDSGLDSKDSPKSPPVTREELESLISELRGELAGMTRQTLSELLAPKEEESKEAEPVGADFSQVESLFTDAFSSQLDALVSAGSISSASKPKHLEALLSLARAKSLPGFQFSQGSDPVTGYLDALKSASTGISTGEPPDAPDSDSPADPLASQRDRIANAWRK